MLQKLKKKKNDIDKIERQDEEPISKEVVEDIIRLIDVANDCSCYFELCLLLSIGEFKIDSASYAGIKLLNDKKNSDTLVITTKNILLTTDTSIDLINIKNIIFNLKFCGD